MKKNLLNDAYVPYGRDEINSECVNGIDPKWVAGLIVYGGKIKLEIITKQEKPKKFDAAVINTGGRFGILLNRPTVPTALTPPEIWVFHLCGNACDLDTDASALFDNYDVKIREYSNGDYTERVKNVIGRLKIMAIKPDNSKKG